jgi:hypothetical protein
MRMVERSRRRFLNALAKNAALMPDLCTFGDSFLASVRAGLAFSGEADSPLTLERVETGVCQSERVD